MAWIGPYLFFGGRDLSRAAIADETEGRITWSLASVRSRRNSNTFRDCSVSDIEPTKFSVDMSCGGIVLNDVFADRQTGLLKSGGGVDREGKKKGSGERWWCYTTIEAADKQKNPQSRDSTPAPGRNSVWPCYGLKLSRATEVQSDQHTTSCVQSSFLYTSFFIIYYWIEAKALSKKKACWHLPSHSGTEETQGLKVQLSCSK